MRMRIRINNKLVTKDGLVNVIVNENNAKR
jgi:hypothetical protein